MPAEVEGARIFLAALRALHGWAAGRRAQELADQLARPPGLGIVLDPDLRERRVDWQFARHARGIRVEDARANATMREQVQQELRFGKVGSGEDALQNFTETVAPRPSSLMPERDWML